MVSPKYPLSLYVESLEAFACIVNKIGPNTDDKGTLLLTSFHFQRKLFIMTLCFLSLNPFLIFNRDFILSPVIIYFP